MGIKELSVGRSDVFRVDPRIICIEADWNVRKDSPEKTAHVRFLADSIKEVGVKVPLLVRLKDEKVFVVDGECRLLATMLAISEGVEIASIPVMAEDRYARPEDRILSMVTCNEGRPLTMLEQADAYRRLMGLGWDEKTIAAKTGYSVTHIKSALNLSTFRPEILRLVSDGKVSPTLALKVVSEKGQDLALETLTEAVAVSAGEGKKKATERHMAPLAGKTEHKVNWQKYGPLFYEAMRLICGTAITSSKFGDTVAAGNELLSQFDDDNPKTYRMEPK